MSPARVLLLLLLTLPGLLVPAGFGLTRCACTGSLRVAHDGAPPSCMAAPKSPAAVGACCHRGGAPDLAERCLAGQSGKGCVCKVGTIPPVPPKHSAPAKRAELTLALWGMVSWRVETTPHQVGTIEARASRGPPAPGARRNLPLLL